MTNAIVSALGQAAKRVEKALGKDAGAAVRDLYSSAGRNAEGVVKRTLESDAGNAAEIEKITDAMAKNASRSATTDAEKLAQRQTQTELQQKLASILDPEKETGRITGADKNLWNGSKPSSALEPPGEGGIPWAGGGTKKLGTLPEDRVTRDADGLITHVDGRPADDYLHQLTNERREDFIDAKNAGTLTRKDTGNAMATGLDRRTGAVYEGYNGRATDVIPENQVHPTLAANRDAMESAGPYTNKVGSDQPFPGSDNPLGHAEVKAANAMLRDRSAAGNLGANPLSEMTFAPQFPFIKSVTNAPTCPNCTGMLQGAHAIYGGLTSEV